MPTASTRVSSIAVVRRLSVPNAHEVTGPLLLLGSWSLTAASYRRD
jgi:hypothetical protein